MIEINLLPGAAPRRARRSLKLPVGFGGKLPSVDRIALGIVAAWLIGGGAIAWLHTRASGRVQDLELAIEAQVQDSIRYAGLIQEQSRLQARRDTIAEKLAIIQEVDAGRYVWAHILDEISRALPDYTWLTALNPVNTGEPLPSFQIVGRTGNTFALTRFMRDLESSPFIRSVKLNSTELVGGAGDRVVHTFILRASYEEPPPELIETVPLFPGEA